MRTKEPRKQVKSMRILGHYENENIIVARITDLLLEQGKQQNQLMIFLGLTKSTYTSWKTGKSNSYMQHIDEIAKYLNVSPLYLLRGDNDDNTDFENKILTILRKLTKEQQEKLLLFAESMCGKPIK